jgi:para-nitrobenzyl esterase
MPQYDAAVLARTGVVVVTVNYRAGFEGFGHLPGVPDNRGLRAIRRSVAPSVI